MTHLAGSAGQLIVAFDPIQAPWRMRVGITDQSASVLSPPSGVQAREKSSPSADEVVGGDPAAYADMAVLLDLDEGPTFVPSPTEHPCRFTRSGWARAVSAPSWAFGSGIGGTIYDRGVCRNAVTGVLPTNRGSPLKTALGAPQRSTTVGEVMTLVNIVKKPASGRETAERQ